MNYWSKLADARFQRRRVLQAGAGAVAWSAFLAACGGGDGGGEGGNASGLLTKPANTSKEAKRGGVLNHYVKADLSSFEPHVTVANGQGAFPDCYSLFVKKKAGVLSPPDWTIDGDMAESWEWSADGLTLAMKLRQGAGWAPVAPVNGRAVTIEDIAYTWNRWGQMSPIRMEYLNSLNPNAPIVNFTTPDSRTWVFHLKFPMAGFLANLASRARQPYIVPNNADSLYNVRSTPVSSGPWYFDKYEPSVEWVYKRNPNYWDKGLPYMDGVNKPIVSEYATGLSQFHAGNLHYFDVRNEDVLASKRDHNDLLVYQSEVSTTGPFTAFGYKPTPPEKTPFRDERVRQAYSMSMDRDLWIEALHNVRAFESEGLSMESRWETTVGQEMTGWSLDPKAKDFGPNAKYFFHDIAEAKKLLSAAGFANGVRVTANWPATGSSIDLPKWVQILQGMAGDAGFQFEQNHIDFNTEYPKYRDGRGNWEGMSHANNSVTSPDAIERLAVNYYSSPGNTKFAGFDPNGVGDFKGDPYVDDLIVKGRSETDTEKRRGIVHDIQRHLAKKVYAVQPLGGASGFLLAWPAVKNYNVFSGVEVQYLNYWLDDTLPPFKKG